MRHKRGSKKQPTRHSDGTNCWMCRHYYASSVVDNHRDCGVAKLVVKAHDAACTHFSPASYFWCNKRQYAVSVGACVAIRWKKHVDHDMRTKRVYRDCCARKCPQGIALEHMAKIYRISAIREAAPPQRKLIRRYEVVKPKIIRRYMK